MAEDGEQQGLPCPVCGQRYTYLQQHLKRSQDQQHKQYREGGLEAIKKTAASGNGQKLQEQNTGQNSEPQTGGQQKQVDEPGQVFEGQGQQQQQQVQKTPQQQQSGGEQYVTGGQQPQELHGHSGETFSCPTCSSPWEKGNESCDSCGETFDCPNCGNSLRPFAEKSCRCGYNLPASWDKVVQNS